MLKTDSALTCSASCTQSGREPWSRRMYWYSSEICAARRAVNAVRVAGQRARGQRAHRFWLLRARAAPTRS